MRNHFPANPIGAVIPNTSAERRNTVRNHFNVLYIQAQIDLASYEDYLIVLNLHDSRWMQGLYRHNIAWFSELH